MTQNFLDHCSAVLIVKNGENTLTSCLDSLQDFAEVVIYDNGSTDKTIEIAVEYTNVSIYHGEFLGFGKTKNYAASLAQYDWIFSLDCDEVLDENLITALKTFNPQSPNMVGEICRENYFCGRAVHTNGWGKDHLIRLYQRQNHQFCGRAVHEKVVLTPKSKKIRLTGKLIHQSILTLSQQLQKIDHYSELYAQSEKIAKYYSFPWIILKTVFAFLRSYIFKMGILSGWRGFAIALGDSVVVFYKYSKVYHLKSNDFGRKSSSHCR